MAAKQSATLPLVLIVWVGGNLAGSQFSHNAASTNLIIGKTKCQSDPLKNDHPIKYISFFSNENVNRKYTTVTCIQKF